VPAAGAPRQRGDQSVGEIGVSVAQLQHGGEHLGIVLDPQGFGLQQAFHYGGERPAPEPVVPLQHPSQLGRYDQADEARLGCGQALQEGRCFRGLGRVILGDVADENVGVEPDQRPPRLRASRLTAPSAGAWRSRRIETGRLRAGTIPRSAVMGSLGSRATVPSGCR